MRFDVVVIGGGVSGIAAALSAAARGARVAIVRPAPGVTALAAGGWRGPLDARLATALAAAGLVHQPVSFLLPHPSGALVPADFAPASHWDARIEAGTLVCGIAGLPGFHARALARLWGDAAQVELTAVTLHAGANTPPAGWSTIALAAELERDSRQLAEALKSAVARTRATRVILPAVLGEREPAGVRAALSEAAGVPVGEALGMVPSLPGWRLDHALLAAAQAAGAQVIEGRARAAASVQQVLHSIQVQHDGTAAEAYEAPRFVLATGKFAGGGVSAQDELREPALHCPLWLERLGADAQQFEPLALTAPERTAPQPLLAAGVRTDARARPVDRRGDVVYENVFVAGSVRAGTEAASLGLGAAAGEGWRAGELATEAA